MRTSSFCLYHCIGLCIRHLKLYSIGKYRALFNIMHIEAVNFLKFLFFTSIYALYGFHDEKKRKKNRFTFLLKIKFVINNNANQLNYSIRNFLFFRFFILPFNVTSVHSSLFMSSKYLQNVRNVKQIWSENISEYWQKECVCVCV